jgi:hypothetical protein
LKSGSPNLLEPSGPVQACNGVALPLHNYVLLLKPKRTLGRNRFKLVDDGTTMGLCEKAIKM